MGWRDWVFHDWFAPYLYEPPPEPRGIHPIHSEEWSSGACVRFWLLYALMTSRSRPLTSGDYALRYKPSSTASG
jgi:hypothetical protein